MVLSLPNPQRTMRRSLTTLVIAFAVPLIAGCGGSGGADSASAPSQAAPPNPPTPTAPGAPVSVKLDEWSVAPAVMQASAGRVRFSASNGGQIGHELVVIRTSKPADQLGEGGEVPETGAVGEIGDLGPGQTKPLTLRLKPGHYALICNLPGHYADGMHADFTVR